MLQWIRSKTGSIIVKALAGLLIVAFAAWGVEDFISSRASDVHVAQVGEVEIGPLELEFALSNEMGQVRRALGGRLTDEQLIGLGIGNAVLQRLIDERAIAQVAQSMGLSPSDAVVSREIRTDPAFQGFDGAFSRAQFDAMMFQSGLSEAGFISQVRSQLASNQLLIASTRASVPSKLVDLIEEYRFETRTADTVRVLSADQTDPGAPTETQLQQVHTEQAERFTAPEYRRITYTHLSPDAMMDEVQVTEAQLQEAYDANSSLFIRPETRAVRQMVLIDEDTVTRATQALDEGQDFMTVATEIAEMEELAVDLGTITREGLLPSLADAAFALDAGGYSEAVRTPLGWHILSVTTINEGEVQELADVRDQVREIVARREAIDALYDLSIRFEDAMGGGATLEEAASEVGMIANSIEAVDRNGLDTNGFAVTQLPEIASLLPVAFATEQGLDSPLTEIGERGYFMVRVDNVIAPALRPLDTVRAEVTDAWRQLERDAMAREAAQQLADAVSAGRTLAAIAQEQDLTLETAGPVRRNDTGEVARQVIGSMFDLDRGQAGIAKVEDGYVAVQVVSIDAPVAGSANADVDVEADLVAAAGQDLSEQLVQALRQDLGVSVNQRIYDLVLQPGQFDPRFDNPASHLGM